MLKKTNLKNTKIKKIVRYDLSFLFWYFLHDLFNKRCPPVEQKKIISDNVFTYYQTIKHK